MIKGAYDHLLSMKVFTLRMNKVFVRAWKIDPKKTRLWPQFGFANHLVLITCFKY